MSIEYSCTACISGCNSGCNTCNSCNIVIGLCNSCQTASEYLNDFNWTDNEKHTTRSTLTASTDTFFTKNEWNSLINYIKNAYNLGTKHSASAAYKADSSLRANETNLYMKATMYNEAYTRMKNLVKDNRETSYTIVNPNDIIYAETFNNLRALANSFQLHPYQCNNCVTCNSCEDCIGCNSCEGVTSYCCYTPPPSDGGS